MSAAGDTHGSVSNQWFTTTHWTVVFNARDQQSPGAAEALNRVCRAYRNPIYNYVRRQGYAPADAEDLTQGFFERLLGKEWLGHVKHRDGKFRSFLITLLNHYLSDQRDRARAQKRGGGAMMIALDECDSEHGIAGELASMLTPEQLFDKQWAETIVERANERLRLEYVASGNLRLFDVLKELEPGERGERTYTEVGAQLGMSESALKSAVFRFRQRRAVVLRDEVVQTVTPAELDEEIRYLLSIIAK